MGGCVKTIQKGQGSARKYEQSNFNWNQHSCDNVYNKTGSNENTNNETNDIGDSRDAIMKRTRNPNEDETLCISANQQQRKKIPLEKGCSQTTKNTQLLHENGTRNSLSHSEQQLQMAIDSKIIRSKGKKKTSSEPNNIKTSFSGEEVQPAQGLHEKKNLSQFIEEDMDLRQTFISSKQNINISRCKMKRYEGGLSVISETSGAEQSTFNKMSIVSITPTYENNFSRQFKSRKMSQIPIPCSPNQKYGPASNQNYFIQVKI